MIKMAKDKHQKIKEEKTKPVKEQETIIAVVGLIFIVLSLLIIANTGIVANALKYAFIFLFGSCYIYVLLFLLFMGGYMVIKKKKLKFFSKMKYVLVFGCFICILALSSSGNEVTITNFSAAFKRVLPNSLAETDEIIGRYGGGWVGYLLIAIFNTLLGSENWSIAIYILFLIGLLYLLFQKQIAKLFTIIKTKIKKSKELKAQKKEALKQKEKEAAVAPAEPVIENQESKEESTTTATYLIQEDISQAKDKAPMKTEPMHRKLADFEQVIDDLQETAIFTRPQVFDDHKKEETSENFPFYPAQKVQKDSSTQNLFVSDASVQPTQEAIKKPITPENDYLQKEKEYAAFTKDLQEQKQQQEESENILQKEETKEQEYHHDEYQLPPLYLLKESSSQQDATYRNEEIARQKADILTQKMKELNVNAAITNYVIGPSVTRYEIMLQPGVRANTFMNLQEDFKLALGATSLRIESPIPGKPATIGIEVPNEIRGMVTLKELMLTLPNKKEKLYVPAGKAISGEPISISITSMPHCLISGATNSGKSVCANSIICSLLLNYKPDELKMIMIDPKKVEMLFYTNLPHLLCPIITESSKALVALDKLVKEMMHRFDTFASLGVKNIASYNEYRKQKNEMIMPFIILIVDEFAELMAYKQSNLVEEKVQTLVQLGRAAGIHLILCTQRPSVNVITGTIKNNIPCRMTFRLSSFADSKTVIDGSGAEKLLNNGDMLLLTPDFTGLRRIQGAFVSDQEIDDIVAYCKKQCAPLYDQEFLDLRTEEEKEFELHTKLNSGNTNEEDNGYNAKYMDVRNFVLIEQKASTTLIQRKFKIGYGKAANYMDMLEDEGIVGPENGSKGREVLMTFEEWEAKNESENN